MEGRADFSSHSQWRVTTRQPKKGQSLPGHTKPGSLHWSPGTGDYVRTRSSFLAVKGTRAFLATSRERVWVTGTASPQRWGIRVLRSHPGPKVDCHVKFKPCYLKGLFGPVIAGIDDSS